MIRQSRWVSGVGVTVVGSGVGVTVVAEGVPAPQLEKMIYTVVAMVKHPGQS